MAQSKKPSPAAMAQREKELRTLQAQGKTTVQAAAILRPRTAAREALIGRTAGRRARNAAKAPATRGGGKATFKGGKTPRVPSQSYGQAQGTPTRKSPVIRTTGGGLPAVKVPTMTPGGDYKLPLVRGRERVYGLAKGGKIVSQRGKATAKRR